MGSSAGGLMRSGHSSGLSGISKLLISAGPERNAAATIIQTCRAYDPSHRVYGPFEFLLDASQAMKRIRVAPGKFVTIPTELAEKAARVFGAGLTRAQVRDLKASEPRNSSLMAGSPKPLAIRKRRA